MLAFLHGYVSPDPAARPLPRVSFLPLGVAGVVLSTVGAAQMIDSANARIPSNGELKLAVGGILLGLGALFGLLWFALELRHARLYPVNERGAALLHPGAEFHIDSPAGRSSSSVLWLEVDVATTAPPGEYTRLEIQAQIGAGGGGSRLSVKHMWRYAPLSSSSKPSVSTAFWGNPDPVPWPEHLVDIRNEGSGPRYRALMRLVTLPAAGPFAIHGRLVATPLRPESHVRLFVADA